MLFKLYVSVNIDMKFLWNVERQCCKSKIPTWNKRIFSNSLKPRKTLLHTRKTLVNRKTFERLNYLVKDTQIISWKMFFSKQK